ncbi:Class V chitinase [Cardamine amara subsp. amara]|uniref:Class V chitinase n=1 Tax=Cardamine amara subsp. amara TaxID=228776 RepID=A0ABD1AEM9_CARAN
MTSAEITPEVKASYWYADGETEESGDTLANIDSSLFTHIFCAYADLDAHTHHVFVSSAHNFKFSGFTTSVQGGNPQVKALLSISGGKAVFKSMANKPKSRKSFIDSSILIARSMGFHGLDLAWQYPNSSEEMSDFGQLLKEWRSAVDDESNRTGNDCLLLTAAVYYTSEYNSASYPIQAIKDSLDWVNIIAYDFYTPESSTVTAAAAGLYDPTKAERTCGEFGLTHWLNAGLPEKKAVFGFSYAGWAWTLKDGKDHGYDAAAKGVAFPPDGSIDYSQIKTFITSDQATPYHDPNVVGDYCYSGKTWIAYDDTLCITAKVQYAKQKGLLGYFAWNVGADDKSVLSKAASAAWVA